jgi:hypothetical protein
MMRAPSFGASSFSAPFSEASSSGAARTAGNIGAPVPFDMFASLLAALA